MSWDVFKDSEYNANATGLDCPEWENIVFHERSCYTLDWHNLISNLEFRISNLEGFFLTRLLIGQGDGSGEISLH